MVQSRPQGIRQQVYSTEIHWAIFDTIWSGGGVWGSASREEWKNVQIRKDGEIIYMHMRRRKRKEGKTRRQKEVERQRERERAGRGAESLTQLLVLPSTWTGAVLQPVGPAVLSFQIQSTAEDWPGLSCAVWPRCSVTPALKLRKIRR